MRNKLSILITLFLISATLSAQSLDASRFEERAFSIGGGITNLLDTYLSPLKYEGAHAMIMSERFSQTKGESGRWFSQSLFALHADYTLVAQGRGMMVGGMADYTYSYYYRPLHTQRWNLYAGAQGQGRIGGIYNLRNSNNPAQLKLGINIAASAMASYRLRLRNTPMSLRLQADMPLLGLAFAPDYRQSYYEIFYLGNSEGCVHATSPFNNLSLRSRVCYDVEFRPCTLRLTLMEDLYHWQLGGQQYRMFTHSVMIGFVRNLYHVERDEEARRVLPY